MLNLMQLGHLSTHRTVQAAAVKGSRTGKLRGTAAFVDTEQTIGVLLEFIFVLGFIL